MRLYWPAVGFLILFIYQGAQSQSAISIKWKTAHASPPPKLSSEQQKLLPLIRLGVSALPEASLIQISGVGAGLLGVPEAAAEELQKSLISYYKVIGNDSAFEGVPSSLGYCFALEQPKYGFAQVYAPGELASETPVILFLHGFGGNFQFYLHFLSKCFPQHLIISPSFGISMSSVNEAYLKECVSAVGRHFGITIQKPALIGLSAGGFGGFREVFRNPHSYRSFTCLAAYPPVKNMPIKIPVSIIAGGNEPFVNDGTLYRAIGKSSAQMPVTLIPNANHFFLLSHQQETKAALIKALSN